MSVESQSNIPGSVPEALLEGRYRAYRVPSHLRVAAAREAYIRAAQWLVSSLGALALSVAPLELPEPLPVTFSIGGIVALGFSLKHFLRANDRMLQEEPETAAANRQEFGPDPLRIEWSDGQTVTVPGPEVATNVWEPSLLVRAPEPVPVIPE